MPFSFLDVEAGQTRKIFLLFLSLFLFYFLGAFLIYVVSFFGFFYDLFSPSSYDSGLMPGAGTVLILFGFALLAAVVHWALSVRNMVNRILSVISAEPADPEDRYHLLLKNVVDEVSIATGGMKIESFVIPSRYMNAFALSDLRGRAVIGVTEGLLTRMNRRQLEAVVAHEAGHLVWGDCVDTTVSCSMAAVYAGLLKMTTAGIESGSGAAAGRHPRLPVSLAVVVVIAVMRFLTLFLNTWLSRERETRADATAVRLTRDPLGLAEALYRIALDRRGGFLSVNELSPIFIVSPSERRLEEGFGLFADLFTTHPPVKKRLDMLLDMGHADYRVLEGSVREKPKEEEDVLISVPEKERVWYALHEKVWQGPFGLVDLQGLGWLGPHTWVTREGDMQVKEAHDYREVNRVLKKGLPQDLHVRSCPSCGKGLEKVYYEGVPIWRCPACRGRLVKSRHMPRIMVRDDITFSAGIRDEVRRIKQETRQTRGKYIPVSDGKRPCPACGNLMERLFYQALLPHRVEIDVCRVCDLFWLDEHEIEIIQYLAEDLSEAGIFLDGKRDS